MTFPAGYDKGKRKSAAPSDAQIPPTLPGVNKVDTIQLTVEEAYTRDVGRGVARIDYDSMDSLGASTGDVIEIRGKRRSVANCLPLYPSDERKGMIRVDGLVRNNTGTEIGDTVILKKIKAVLAEKVIVAPLEAIPPIDEHYLADALENVPLIKGDNLMVPYFGSRSTFQVMEVTPTADAVIVKQKTIFHIAEKVEMPTRITYEDVGGMQEVVDKLRRMIEIPIRHPEVRDKLGFELPKGILLYGPAGTGKTLLAKAIANETGVNFVGISGQAIPAIKNNVSGESEARLRDIFKDAKDNAPSIIFIDDLDYIAPAIEEVKDEVQRRLVRQLLLLMDWIQPSDRVIVIGATQRLGAIDPALRKTGRFDREIEFKVPDKRGRLEILQIHTRSMPLDSEVDQEKIAEVTTGFVGADLERLCKEAAMKCQLRVLPELNIEDAKLSPEVLSRLIVTMKDFDDVLGEVAIKSIPPSSPEIGDKAKMATPNLTPGKESSGEITCQKCNNVGTINSKFCSTCGANLSYFCGKCSNKNPDGAKFCNQCGSPLT